MALSKREQRLLVFTISILVAGVTYVLAGWLLPAWNKTSRELRDQRRELEGYRQVVAQQPEWEQEYRQLSRQVGEKITQVEEMSDLLKRLEEVGGTAGVVISTRKPLPENDRGLYRELPVQCRLDATIESLVKFLYTLRTGAGFVNVEYLEVRPQPNNQNILRCDVVIHALAAKQKGGGS